MTLDTGLSDADLIGRSVREPELFTAIFDRYSNEILRYAHARLGGDLAEDVTAETFLAAFRNRGRFDLAARSARPWLYGIAVRQISKHRRTEARRLRLLRSALADGPTEDIGDRSAERVTAAQLGPRLAAVLAGLPRQDRELLLLVAWAGLSYAEAAAAMEVTEIAVVAPGGQARHLGTVVTAAWTVRGNTDGTVTIQLHQLIDPAKLQRVLRADGVNAIVGPAWYKGVIDGRHTYVSCQYQNLPAEPPAVQRAVVTSRDGFTIRPSAMPPGSALFIVDSVKHEGNAGYGMVLRPVVLKNSELPPCTPVP